MTSAASRPEWEYGVPLWASGQEDRVIKKLLAKGVAREA